MQNLQTSEFLNLLGHFSGSAGSYDVFPGRWNHTAISGTLLWRGVFSRTGWGCFCALFCFFTIFFSVPAASAILNRTFRIFHQNFLIFVRRLLELSSAPGRSLLSSTNESGCSRLGCHHPVMLLQHSTGI